MELMGDSLECLLQKQKHKVFSVKTVAMVGIQMVTLLEEIHKRDIIHRDIKPDNFVIGYTDPKKVYILDFGLAKRFRSSNTHKHNQMVKNKKLTGTARYASINALQGFEQSRRDDLESVGYVLMYFLRGRLPWQGLVLKGKENKYERILKKKKETETTELCDGFPKQFEDYLDYTKNLGYEEDPDYNYLRGLFEAVIKENEFTLDNMFDWVKEDDSTGNTEENNQVQIEEDKENKKNDNLIIVEKNQKNNYQDGMADNFYKANQLKQDKKEEKKFNDDDDEEDDKLRKTTKKICCVIF